MRRLSVILLSLVLTNLAFAAGGWDEPKLVDHATRRAQGEAMILHPSRALTAADRAELAAQGIHVKHALTGGRYLARVSDPARVVDARVISIEPLTAAMKIHPSARHEVARGRAWAELNVIFQEDVPFSEAREAVLAAGGALARPFDLHFLPSKRIEVRIAPASLDALAADDRVLTIAGPRRFRAQSDNTESADLAHVTELFSAPYGLSGAGVTVSLFELAEGQASHVEFAPDRLTVHASGGSTDDKKHATHVAGTIGASGVRPDAKGMAPAAHIHQFCVSTPANDCDGDFLDLKDTELQPLGVVADNNSWGFVLGWSSENGFPVWNDLDIYWGAYDLILTAPEDEISNTRGVLFVHSAGNEGNQQVFSTEFSEHRHVDPNSGDTLTDQLFCYSKDGTGGDCPATCNGTPVGCEIQRHHTATPFDTMGLTASAKNVIAVGAVNGNKTIVGFSSRGPAKDGRVKPDVVARGFSVLSSVPTNSYASLNGTSMSSPAVTGIAALLTEQWRMTFEGADPTPAQLKSLIIAGAEDLGNPGPDYTYGFGLVNAKESVDIIRADGGQGTRIHDLSVAQGQTSEVDVGLTEQQNLRIVLGWPDPSIPFLGDELAEKALVNDLDVRVIDPDGATHRPYVLDQDSPDANATTGVNTVDNTEMLEIASAAPGVYRILVDGTNVAEGPQDAVLISSAEAIPPCLDVQENNDTPGTAVGNLVPGQLVNGAICSAGDLDYFKFTATKSGPVSVTIETRDTPLRLTLTGSGISTSIDVAANSTGTLSANAATVPNAMTLKIEANGALGLDNRYSFAPNFGETNQPRRRAVHH